MYFFYSWGGGLPKNYSDEGGAMRKKIGNWGGGHTIFKLLSSKSHKPPLPHKKMKGPFSWVAILI